MKYRGLRAYAFLLFMLASAASAAVGSSCVKDEGTKTLKLQDISRSIETQMVSSANLTAPEIDALDEAVAEKRTTVPITYDEGSGIPSSPDF